MGKKTLNEISGALSVYSPIITDTCVFNVARDNFLQGNYRKTQAINARDKLLVLADIIAEAIEAIEREEGLNEKQN